MRINVTETEDTLGELLGHARAALVRNPRLVRTILGALAAEGRAFAGTPEGAALRRQLLDSPMIERLGLFWTALGLPSEALPVPAMLPSRWIGLVGVLAEHPLALRVLDGLARDRGEKRP